MYLGLGCKIVRSRVEPFRLILHTSQPGHSFIEDIAMRKETSFIHILFLGLLLMLVGIVSTAQFSSAQTEDEHGFYLPIALKESDMSQVNPPAGGTATPTQVPPEPTETQPPTPTIVPEGDNDGDGLTNAHEIELGTNPNVADTDGDGFDDKEEVDNWDPNSGSHLRFNPLVADVPSLRVEQFSVPVVEMFYKTETAQRVTKGMSNASESEVTTITERGRENVHKIEEQHAVKVNAKVAKRGPIKSGSLSVSYGYNHTDTNTNKNYWNETTKNQNRQASSDFFKETKGEVIEEQGGKIQVTMGLLNDSDISYTLSNMDVTAYMIDPRNPNNLIPVGTLTHDGDLSFTMIPQGKVENPAESLFRKLEFRFDTDKPQEIAKVLENSNQLILIPDNYKITGQDPNLDLNLAAQNIQARTAEVIIDFGGQQGLKTEKYRVAVDTGNGNLLSLDTLLTNHLNIGYAFAAGSIDGAGGNHNGLTQLRSVSMSNANRSYWLIAHTFQPAGSPPGTTKTVLYNILDSSYVADDIKVRKGDTLHLVYVTDSDLDGLSNRLETLGNTDPNNPDTDGDGLDDALETYGWYLNLKNNACADASDSEATLVKSDPLVKDTDEDSAEDGTEFEACTSPQGDLEVEISGPEVAEIGQAFSLTADPSNESDPANLSYEWIQTGGPVVSFTANGATLEVGPQPNVTGLRFEVTVTDEGQNDQSAVSAATVVVVNNKDQAVFVDLNNGDVNNTGRTPSSPIQTLDQALNLQAFSSYDLYLMTPPDGRVFVYNQTIELTGSRSIFGGFDQTWAHDPKNRPTPITVNEAHIGIQISDFSQSTLNGISLKLNSINDGYTFGVQATGTGDEILTLRNVLIEGGNAGRDSAIRHDRGAEHLAFSSYGVWAKALERLVIIDSEIVAGKGVDGVIGKDGVKGRNGRKGANQKDGYGGNGGGSSSDFKDAVGGKGGDGGSACGGGWDGANGKGPHGGAGGKGGTVDGFFPFCFAAETAKGGSRGGNGAHGANGVVSSAGNEAYFNTGNGLYWYANYGLKGKNGKPGSGGGGGGGSANTNINPHGGGGGGEGGWPGTGGYGGTAGGGSFGLSALDVAVVEIKESRVASGQGGWGGSGGYGQAGGTGGAGGSGSIYGGGGGFGGFGGWGGNGGGGGGGPVAAIVLAGDSQVDVRNSTLETSNSGRGWGPVPGMGGWNYGIYFTTPTATLGNEIDVVYQLGTAGNGAPEASTSNR